MLEYSMTDEGYIKVVETLQGWNETRVKTVLYDMVNKKSKVGDDPWYDMTESAVNWVNKYYVPGVKNYVKSN